MSEKRTDTPRWPQGLIIYNVFQRLLGHIENWYQYVDHAADMQFNTIYINPFHYPGFSGSLYAPKNYYEFNPLFMDRQNGVHELQKFCIYVHEKGMKIVMDLIINHTAVDADLVKEHPDWYQRNADGSIRNPQAMDPADARNITVWGDLAEIDNEHSSDREALWLYWERLIEYYMNVGFDGFRCDAAYQVPAELWSRLIGVAKKNNSDVLFVAETLGCKEDAIERLARVGFDYVYNSTKWWNFRDDWCMKQYEMSSRYAASLSFPETHDTARLFAEVHGSVRAMKMRYQFAAFFSKAVMMPLGFEYGFKQRVDVVRTQPQDWEEAAIDICDFIADVHTVKKTYQVFNEDNKIDILWSGNGNIFMMVKTSHDGNTHACVLINLDEHHDQTCTLAKVTDVLRLPDESDIKDISVEDRIEVIGDSLTCTLRPLQVKILFGEKPQQWWG